MAKPICNQTPPDLTQSDDMLKYLLKIEQVRLETAIRIEKERNIVFPETSVIIHDILKLNNALGKNDDKEEWFPFAMP